MAGTVQARQSGYLNPSSVIVVGLSPFVYTNTDDHEIDVAITGGTLSLVEFQRGLSVVIMGVQSGMFRLSVGDSLVVTYVLPPVMTKIPR